MDEFLKQIIREAGSVAKQYFHDGVSHTTKEHLGDLLTEADVAVSDYLIAEIQKKYPEHKIFSEERQETINPEGTIEWVIDPIDGTRNFAMGIPLWGTLIAVLDGDETILAAVYNPNADELFFAKKGEGAFMNGEKMQVNGTKELDHCFSICVRGSHADAHGPRFKKALSEIVNNTAIWMHNFGTMVPVCNVAGGGIDFYISNCGKDYDYLAPVCICQEAGAVVTDSFGQPWSREKNDLVIANKHLHPKVLELFA